MFEGHAGNLTKERRTKPACMVNLRTSYQKVFAYLHQIAFICLTDFCDDANCPFSIGIGRSDMLKTLLGLYWLSGID